MRDSASIRTLGHWSTALLAHLVVEPVGEVLFQYVGAIDHQKLEALTAIAEERSLAANDAVSVRKRLFNVLVESLENVRVHTSPEFVDSGFAQLIRHELGYRLVVGNTLPAVSAELLTHRVAVLNEMDEADLREYFLKLLSNDGRTERGGAGLGLLTMARKSTRPMVVHSGSNDGVSVHFALELTVALR